MSSSRRARLLQGVLCSCVLLLVPATALAFVEPNGRIVSGCQAYCHNPSLAGCESCHGNIDVPPEAGSAPNNGYEQGSLNGPHGGYTVVTKKCDNCHNVHAAPGPTLLPAPTVVGACFTCHDGTGGQGVYGTVQARTGSPAPAGHRYETTGAIPGGDAATGGSATRAFRGPGGSLICTDCHSVHGSDVVDRFYGDRRRIRVPHSNILSSRLLKKRPTGASASVARYGSDWCLACHAGRASGTPLHNHPVDSLITTSVPFDYASLAILASENATGATVIGRLGGVYNENAPPFPQDGYPAHDWPDDLYPPGNRGFLMPYPRTPEQGRHYPICQQCHEDARNVGELTGDGSIGDAEPAVVGAGDGVYYVAGAWVDDSAFSNPWIQNFPHETANRRMLVETEDDLCLNCHPPAGLP